MTIDGDAALAARIEDVGAFVEDDEVHVTRIIGARSKAILGARPVASSVLGECLASCVTLHGQHGHTRLTKPSEQRRLLDESDPEIRALLPIVRDAWANLRSAADALATAAERASDAVRDFHAWTTFVADVDAVAPEAGEDDALAARIATLTAMDVVLRTTSTMLAVLINGDGVDMQDAHSLLLQARKAIEARQEAPEFEQWHARLIELAEQVQEIGLEIERFVADLDVEPGALDDLMQRRSDITSLLRRWNTDLPGLRARYEEASRAIALARDPEEHLRAMEMLLAHCTDEYVAACARVHENRVRAAHTLQDRVMGELRALDLPHATFSIAVESTTERTQYGTDDVVFRFSANPGHPEQPLSNVASGGELSRVMLALETAAALEHGGTLIFDEVDAGVGGRAALEVGRRLAHLATRHQVIVVTHLAQVAAFADAHVLVEKSVVGGETRTETRILAPADRVRELARMLSGFEESETAMAHAHELLASAVAARRRQA